MKLSSLDSYSAFGRLFHFLALISLGLIFSYATKTFAVEPSYRYLPTTETRAVQGIGRDYAVLSADINPQGSDTQMYFEYGVSPAAAFWSSRSPYAYVGKDFSGVRKIFWLSGLRPDTAYYYRSVASNKNGTVYGSIVSFKTGSERISAPASSSARPVVPKKPEIKISDSETGIETIFRTGLNFKDSANSPELKEIASKSKPAFINLVLFSVLIVIVYFIVRK